MLSLLAAAILTEKGIQDGWAVADDLRPILTRQEARLMRRSGASWVRVHFRLSQTHQTWSPELINAYKEVIRALEAERLKPLGLVTYESQAGGQSAWTANSAEAHRGTGDNPYVQEFGSKTFTKLLASFPSVQQWEIWNEPNCWTVNTPGDPSKLPGQFYIYPSNFAFLLKHCREAAEGQKKPPKLIFGGLLGADFTDDLESNLALPYLRSTFEAGRKLAGWGPSPPFDAFGLHLYVGSQKNLTPDGFRRFPEAFLMESAKLADLPTWITEAGWTSDGNAGSERLQADRVNLLYSALKGLKGLGPSFYFKFRDEPSAGLTYGLFRSDGSSKPSLKAFRDS